MQDDKPDENKTSRGRPISKRRVETLLKLSRELEDEWREAIHEVRSKRPDDDLEDDSESIAQMLTSRLDQIVSHRRKIQVALERLTDGSYGICEDCGQRIPAARLEANPEAVRCVECQRKADRMEG